MADWKNSPAYAVLPPGARRVLRAIERSIGDGSSASVSYTSFWLDHNIEGKLVSPSLKLLNHLGMIDIESGPYRSNVFRLSTRWRTIDALEAARLVKLARLPKPPRVAAPKPPKPAPTPKPVKVEPPRTIAAPRAVAAAPVVHGRRSIDQPAGCCGPDRRRSAPSRWKPVPRSGWPTRTRDGLIRLANGVTTIEKTPRQAISD